jgi:hypothetical protein
MDKSNNTQPRPAARGGSLVGRWFWLVGLSVGILFGMAVAFGVTIASASTEQVK